MGKKTVYRFQRLPRHLARVKYTMATKQEAINKLTSYLFHHQEKNVAIPLIADKKQPVKGASYKGGNWTWQDFEACSHKLIEKGDTFDIGILARSLLVLDADNMQPQQAPLQIAAGSQFVPETNRCTIQLSFNPGTKAAAAGPFTDCCRQSICPRNK